MDDQLPSNKELVEWCLNNDIDINGIMELSKIVYRMVKAYDHQRSAPPKPPLHRVI